MSTSSPAEVQAPDPLTEPGDPTRLAALIETGRYIDHNLQPTLNDVPAILAALIYGEAVGPFVQELRQAGYSDAEISSQVSHVISPPVPGATAQVIQGVDPAAHDALQQEVAALRQAVADLHAQRQELPAGAAPAPAEAPAPTSGAPGTIATTQDPREQEVQELRALVDSLSAQVAAGQHPTATSEPEDQAEDAAEVPPTSTTPAPADQPPTEPLPDASPAAPATSSTDTTPSEPTP